MALVLHSRIVFVRGDIEKSGINSSLIKNLTGGDSYFPRIFDMIAPTRVPFKIIFVSDSVPVFEGSDAALLQRQTVIHFDSEDTSDLSPRKPGLPDAMVWFMLTHFGK